MRAATTGRRLTLAPVVAGATVALVALIATGCSARPPVSAGVASTIATAPAASLVSGPAPAAGKEGSGWPGAAGRALRCSTEPVGGTSLEVPFDGEDTGATPAAALDVARRWGDFDGVQSGFVLERVSGPRRLYVYRLDGRPKQALILRHGPALKGDGTRTTVPRWWLESWGRCDWSELPSDVAAARGLQLWSDGRDRPVPTTAVVSFEVPCAAGVTVLDRGDTEYARNADGFPGLVPKRFRTHVPVPGSANDSGYHRDGDRLWWAADGSGAYVGDGSDAEFWPLATTPIRCG